MNSSLFTEKYTFIPKPCISKPTKVNFRKIVVFEKNQPKVKKITLITIAKLGLEFRL